MTYQTKSGRWFWTPEELDEAKRMWEDGCTSFAIADAIGYTGEGVRTRAQKDGWRLSKEGATRKHQTLSTIVSKSNHERMLPPRNPKPGVVRDRQRREKEATAVVVEAVEVVVGVGAVEAVEDREERLVDRIEGKRLDIMQLTSKDCRWPTNNEAPYEFCGEERVGKNYCVHHEKMAVRKPGEGGKLFDPHRRKNRATASFNVLDRIRG